MLSFIIPINDSILLAKKGDKWHLPSIHFDTNKWLPASVEKINEMVFDKYGIRTVVVRHLSNNGENHLCELELLDDSMCKDLIACPIQSFDELHYGESFPTISLEKWLYDRNKRINTQNRSPWEKQGWISDTTQWIESELKVHHINLNGPITQIKGAYSWSCIYKIPTSAGKIFFKAVRPIRPTEIEIIKILSRHIPIQFPQIIRSHPKEPWMLMKDFGGDVLEPTSYESIIRSVKDFASIQLYSLNFIEELLEIECPIIKIQDYVTLFLQLIQDKEIMTNGSYALNVNEFISLESIIPDVEKMVNNLSNASAPLCLHHQDFRIGNIAQVDDSHIFFDLGDVVLSHPFFSLHAFIHDLNHNLNILKSESDSSDKSKALMYEIESAYTSVWSEVLNEKQIQLELELTRDLFHLERAVRFYRELQILEEGTPWYEEVSNAVMFHLKAIIKKFRR